MSLKGRNAIVTGGSRGIGAATVRALAREGANVLIVFVTERSVQISKDLIAEIEGLATGAEAYSVQADMCDLG
jgi:3-oxoacyl-[acyl-carrier protein] reductase